VGINRTKAIVATNPAIHTHKMKPILAGSHSHTKD